MRWQSLVSAGLLLFAALLGIFLAGGITSDANPALSVSAKAEKTPATTSTTSLPVDNPTTTTSKPFAPAPPPAEVRVALANGSGVRGAAATRSAALVGAGYKTLTPFDAKDRTATSIVYFRDGSEASAGAVADLLGITSTGVLPADFARAPAEANVIVLIGSDLAGNQ